MGKPCNLPRCPLQHVVATDPASPSCKMWPRGDRHQRSYDIDRESTLVFFGGVVVMGWPCAEWPRSLVFGRAHPNPWHHTQDGPLMAPGFGARRPLHDVTQQRQKRELHTKPRTQPLKSSQAKPPCFSKKRLQGDFWKSGSVVRCGYPFPIEQPKRNFE